MIVPDVNLLVYAHNGSASLHEAAQSWWQAALKGPEPVGIPWIVAIGFVRITTNPSVVAPPLAPEQAVGYVRNWLNCEHISILNPGAEHLDILQRNLDATGTGANLVTDAHIAALAIEHGAEVHSNDADFSRFPGLQWRNPVAACGYHHHRNHRCRKRAAAGTIRHQPLLGQLIVCPTTPESNPMQLTDLIAQAPWREAKTYRQTWPHEYILVQKDNQRPLFDAVCARICAGEALTGRFFGITPTYLFIADHKYWCIPACDQANPDSNSDDDLIVLNRARLYHDRRDFIIQPGDTGMPADYPVNPPHQDMPAPAYPAKSDYTPPPASSP